MPGALPDIISLKTCKLEVTLPRVAGLFGHLLLRPSPSLRLREQPGGNRPFELPSAKPLNLLLGLGGQLLHVSRCDRL
jgi:hypothetical protein